MSVKWKGVRSKIRDLYGGGAQGSYFGILEYLSQGNDSAAMVSVEDKFKFVDDLSILEIIDLLNIGIASYNIKQHVPSDIPLHNQFIPAVNLESQKWLNEINDWTTKNKMLINEKKTKAMIFNFTQDYQFGTRLQLKNHQPNQTSGDYIH